MRVLRGIGELREPPERAVVTIGNFDGVHVGHRAILETVTERARALRGTAVVYTFDPHPRKVLQPDRAPRLLTTLEQKLELLEREGIELVIVEPFDAAFARTSPETFVRRHLQVALRPVEVYVGYDFHFGHDREGSMRLLTELAPRLGFAVTIIPEVTLGDRDVNSTRIRELLARGEVEEAGRLLGRSYTIRGRVVRGDARGQKLGFPTANLEPENEIVPAHGVYAARVRMLEGGEPSGRAGHPAVVNVGRRPTFVVEGGDVVEAHLIGYEGNLYGRRLEVAFVSRLREERRFEGPDALQEQIAADVREARRRLEAR